MPYLILIAVLGAWLGFANQLFQIPVLALAFPLGLSWIAFRAYSWKRAFFTGWLAGTLACTGCLYWMVVPVAVYSNLPWYVALPCPVLAGGALGLYYAGFCVAMYHAGRRVDGVLLCVLAGMLWTCMEQLMGVMFTGFPWMNLASAFVPWPVFTQLASVIGAYALSGLFVMLAVAALLYSTIRGATLLGVALLMIICGFGVYRLQAYAPEGREFIVGLVQGNVDQSLKWNPKYQTKTVTSYMELSRDSILKGKPDLVVWPETAMPFYFQDDTVYGRSVRRFARKSGTAILTGAPAYKVTDPAKRRYVLFNRAFLVDGEGMDTGKYDKEHLVPFGEYMPLEDFMPFEKLVQAAGNFKPGNGNEPIRVKDVPFGVLVCYEAIFPELAQKQVANGAQLLVNISNDAWFGETAAPMQHLALTALRALEQGRWIARCTNTGITAFIDPLGRFDSIAPQFVPVFLNGTVRAVSGVTVFHKIQPWLGPVLAVSTLLWFAWIIISRRKKTNTLTKNS
ncbi:apolipoprotein N-acyltransferase [Salidesulfovibrio onnuriiensis]|uniref:apolipoprotein N-acyltransferase n=1 Tax=Salidesulfovibrio onnuriiensis TaxID=2583823 RepID=UPI0011CC7600|nr:apolipoprotein N-acyltransferase [Salidesulfovibrio onnuriiensis]